MLPFFLFFGRNKSGLSRISFFLFFLVNSARVYKAPASFSFLPLFRCNFAVKIIRFAYFRSHSLRSISRARSKLGCFSLSTNTACIIANFLKIFNPVFSNEVFLRNLSFVPNFHCSVRHLCQVYTKISVFRNSQAFHSRRFAVFPNVLQ